MLGLLDRIKCHPDASVSRCVRVRLEAHAVEFAEHAVNSFGGMLGAPRWPGRLA